VSRFLHAVWSWCLERLAMAKEEVKRQWLIDMHAPLGNRDPDDVSDDVAEEEMQMFHTLRRQTGGGG
jgi:hypothetical protein